MLMKLRWRIISSGLVLIAVILLILVFSAGSWLETDTGRNLLQRELSRGLNLDAELKGDYSLKLFPGIRIAGEQLRLSPVHTNRALAEISQYELHLALLPLLRKEILIHEVAVHEGSLDLDLLSDRSESGQEDAALQLPKIESLLVTGLRLLRSGKELLTVSRLDVRGFAANRTAPINLVLTLPSGEGKPGSISLEGFLQIDVDPLMLMLDTEGLLLSSGGQSWPLGTGQLRWSGETGRFSAQLRGELLGFTSHYELSMRTEDALVVQALLEFESSDSRLLKIRLEARDENKQWLLEPVELNLDNQELHGSGCLSTGGETLLQLHLRANQLDLDALQKLLPAELLSQDAGADSVDLALPLQLAIVLEAAQITLSGAKAREVRLLLGPEPDCKGQHLN